MMLACSKPLGGWTRTLISTETPSYPTLPGAGKLHWIQRQRSDTGIQEFRFWEKPKIKTLLCALVELAEDFLREKTLNISPPQPPSDTRIVSPRPWTTSRTTSKNLDYSKHHNWNLQQWHMFPHSTDPSLKPQSPFRSLTQILDHQVRLHLHRGGAGLSVGRSQEDCHIRVLPPLLRAGDFFFLEDQSLISVWNPDWRLLHIFSQSEDVLWCVHMWVMSGTHLFTNSTWGHQYCNDDLELTFSRVAWSSLSLLGF